MPNYDAWKTTERDPFADDERPEESQRCRVCGADENDDCAADCCCQSCDFARDEEAERRQQARVNDPTASEAASFERDVQDVIYRSLK